MAFISAHRLRKSFGSRVLFQDVSFEVGPKDHVGLVGANGAGKSTLFQMLLGLQTPDEGEVHKAKLLRIGYLEQAPAPKEGETVYDMALAVFAPLMETERLLEEVNARLQNEEGRQEALILRQHQLQEAYQRDGGFTYRSRTRSALRGLGFTQEEIELPASSLSGGQLGKIMLARVLLSGADLLLLDEPTNHLDIKAVEWLEAYLKGFSGAYIVISHDRYFLDQCTNKTLELYSSKLFMSNGNYTRHVEQRAGEQEILRRHYYNTQKEIRRIYGIVEQQRRWNRERNIRTAESKLKQIDRLKATLVEPERAQEGIHFAFTVRQPGGNDVLIAQGLQKAYGPKRLFAHADLHIRAGERVCLLGPNGCGKTTLLKILMGKEPADAGAYYFGAGVEPAYYEQTMRALQENNTVLQEIAQAYPRMRQTQLRNALAAFLFRGDEVEKQIRMLSGGEKAKVQLLKLMLSGSNMLLLDEPTNHLDIASREALEQALETYDGAILLVTHDRYLVNRIADRVLYMEENGLVETIGGYDAFVEWLASCKEEEPPAHEKPKNAYQAQKELQAAIAKAKAEVAKVERAVAEGEALSLRLEQALMQPAVSLDYKETGRLAAELEACKKALEEEYHAWERAQCKLEQLLEEGERG